MSSPSSSPPVRATATVPWIARFLITTLEPIFALVGVATVLFSPQQYVSGMTRESIKTIDPATSFVYTQLGGGWLVIIFSEMVIMRLIDDLRVWKLLCISILLSDLLYTHSLAEAVGGWVSWAALEDWTTQDWVATITTWPFLLMRVSIVLGFWDEKSKTS